MSQPPSAPLTFVIPGDLQTRTGGYRYDARIVQGLRERSRSVDVVSLEGNYPFPDAVDLASADARLGQLPDGSQVLIDGLAGSTMPRVLARHASRLQLVLLIHHPLALETGLDAEQISWLESQEREALAQAERIITTSGSTAQTLQAYGVAARAIRTVCPAVDPAPLAAGSQDGHSSLLCVATLTPRKGHDVLLQALATLTSHPWQLICAGSAERDHQTRDRLQMLRQEFSLQDRVQFTGEINDPGLEMLYQQADLFVLASHHEGYGMVLDEAIAHGLPIIASDAGAIADTIPERAGLLFPAGDSQALARTIERWFCDAELRCGLRQAARSARLTQRDWAMAAAEFDEALS